MRASNCGARYCNSIATGPAQAMVSVPAASLRGTVVAASAGPITASQSEINVAMPGAFLRKIGRNIGGSTAEIERGP